jgi:hypothetical protein
MTLRLSLGWAGARGALTAIPALAAVVVSERRRFLACVAIAEHAKIFARLTLANCGCDAGDAGVCGGVPAHPWGECDGIEKFPETRSRSGCVSPFFGLSITGNFGKW